jgi:hypothetical protein
VTTLVEDRDRWDEVVLKLRHREMPPDEEPQPPIDTCEFARQPFGDRLALMLGAQHELATRLSYFLWASMPDESLRRAADAGTLRDPQVLAAQVRRMLRDPKASAPCAGRRSCSSST